MMQGIEKLSEILGLKKKKEAAISRGLDQRDPDAERRAQFEKTRLEKEKKQKLEDQRRKQEFEKTAKEVSAASKDDIRLSLQRKKVKLMYRPVFDSGSNMPFMHEVMPHLILESGFVIEPKRYVESAVNNGLGSMLDETMLKLLLEKQGQSPLPFSMYLTKTTMSKSLDFFELMMMQTMELSFPPENLLFQLRLEDLGQDSSGLEFIRECKAMGCHFSMDYILGGAKVLFMMKKLQMDYVRINGAHYVDFATNENQRKKFEELLTTGAEIDLPIIVLNVSSEEMATFCKNHGAPFLMGDHMAVAAEKPLE